jgi:hypothetical protein
MVITLRVENEISSRKSVGRYVFQVKNECEAAHI